MRLARETNRLDHQSGFPAFYRLPRSRSGIISKTDYGIPQLKAASVITIILLCVIIIIIIIIIIFIIIIIIIIALQINRIQVVELS